VRWGVVIDLRKCIGCKACTVVCEQTNKVPVNSWRRVVDCGISMPPDRQRMSIPISCMHCKEALCVKVCPTTATYLRSDGIIDINYDLCIGCGYCIVACPYHARSIVYPNKSEFEVITVEQGFVEGNANHEQIGICTKCDFCLSRIDEGIAKGLNPGQDADATPMCVISCTSNALHFGDLDDSDCLVSKLIQENETVRLQEQMKTQPSVYYIVE